MLLDFVQGNNIISETKYRCEASGDGAWTVEGRRPHDKDAQGNQLPLTGVLPGVVAVDDGNGNITYQPNTKAVYGQDYWANRAWSDITEEFVMDGSYISLREVMLSYNFKKSIIAKTPFTGITYECTGQKPDVPGTAYAGHGCFTGVCTEYLGRLCWFGKLRNSHNKNMGIQC